MKNDNSNDLIDYKFYCFNGKPMYCQVIQDRTTKETIDFFDMNWIHQEFIGLITINVIKNITNSVANIKKPINFNKMQEISALLSKNVPFLRVDFYEINNQLFVGELTFYPASGFGEFYPYKYNKIIGDMLKINL